jgi:hypothetical protein
MSFTDPSKIEGTEDEKLAMVRVIRDAIRHAVEEFCRQEQPSGTWEDPRFGRRTSMSTGIVQVQVNDRSIGIIGLKKVMTDLVKTASGKTDAECREYLFQGISGDNYIPLKMAEAYKDVLLRAFKTFTWEAADQVPVGGVRIRVLGPGS